MHVKRRFSWSLRIWMSWRKVNWWIEVRFQRNSFTCCRNREQSRQRFSKNSLAKVPRTQQFTKQRSFSQVMTSKHPNGNACANDVNKFKRFEWTVRSKRWRRFSIAQDPLISSSVKQALIIRSDSTNSVPSTKRQLNKRKSWVNSSMWIACRIAGIQRFAITTIQGHRAHSQSRQSQAENAVQHLVSKTLAAHNLSTATIALSVSTIGQWVGNNKTTS